MSVESAQRALDRAERDLARNDLGEPQRRSAQRRVDQARRTVQDEERKLAKKLERQGYEVTSPGRRGR